MICFLLQALSLAVSLFHAAINERTEYTHCGWNQDYNFGETDYELCVSHANKVMEHAAGEEGDGTLSLSCLRYMVSDCTYGGRMEDEWDIRTLQVGNNSKSLSPLSVYRKGAIVRLIQSAMHTRFKY